MNNLLSIFEGSEDGYSRDFYLNSLKEAGFNGYEILFLSGKRCVYGGIK